VTLVNGEGFKLTEADSTLMESAGITLAPNFSGWKPSDHAMPFISNFMISLDLKI